MPPQAVGGLNNNGGIPAFIRNLPPVTRLLMLTFIFTALLGMLGMLPAQFMSLDWTQVFRFPPQIWRLVTNFTVIGLPSLGFLFRMLWLVQYGGQYERAKFGGNAADGFTMLLFGMVVLTVLDVAFPPARLGFQGLPLLYMFIYLWSRTFAQTRVSFMGIVTLPGVYLPAIFLAMDFFQGAPITPTLLGVAAGHLYYFLTEVYPLTSGRHLIRTPQWLARFVARWGLGTVPVQQTNFTHPGDMRFRAFSGRGRRLVD